MNHLDRILEQDGRILHALGIQLQRDAFNVAHPAPVTSTPVIWRRCAWHGGVIGVRSADASESAGAFTDTICPTCREKFFAEVQSSRAA